MKYEAPLFSQKFSIIQLSGTPIGCGLGMGKNENEIEFYVALKELLLVPVSLSVLI